MWGRAFAVAELGIAEEEGLDHRLSKVYLSLYTYIHINIFFVYILLRHVSIYVRRIYAYTYIHICI